MTSKEEKLSLMDREEEMEASRNQPLAATADAATSGAEPSGAVARDTVFQDDGGLWVRDPLGNCRPFDIYDYESLLSDADAVPDLLAAVRALLPEGWGDDDTMDHMPGVKLARAALAKAESK